MSTVDHDRVDDTQRSSWHDDARFGLHFDLHARSWYRGVGSELLAEDLASMLAQVRPDFVQCDSKGHEGLTTWPTKSGYSAPGLEADSLRVYREVTRSLGLPLVVHYSGVWDAEAIRRHPEWAAIGPDDAPSPIATCRTHGYEAELMIPQLREIVTAYEVDGIWVDGDNWGSVPCWCERCQAEFRRRNAYSGPIPKSAGDTWWAEWMDFHRSLFREYVARYTEAVRDIAPNCAVVSSWMHSLRMPEEYAPGGIDYLSGDFHYAFGLDEALPDAAFRDGLGVRWELMVWGFTMNPDHPGGHAMKLPEQLDQEAAVVLARGGTIALYDQPTSRGRHVAWHTDVLAGVAEFCRARRELPRGSSDTEVLVLVNPTEHYAVSEKLFDFSTVTESIRGAVYALSELHIPFDLRTIDSGVRLADYRVVILPEQGDLSEWRERLEEYVDLGGQLIVTGADAASLGADVIGVLPGTGVGREWAWIALEDGTTAPVMGPWRDPELHGAEAVAWCGSEDFDSGDPASAPAPAIMRQVRGTGSVFSCFAPLFRSYQRTRYPRARRVVGELLQRIPDLAVATDAPPWVHFTRRREEDESFVHIVNTASGTPLSPRNASVEGAHPHAVTVRLHTPGPVTIVPSDTPFEYDQEDGSATVRIPALTTHVALRFPIG